MMRLASHGKGTSISTRSLDLSSAYRQLTVSESSQKFAYICVFSPTSKRGELFKQVALPFGSKSAVNAFIRCARCLQWLVSTGLRIPLSCYFDDFVIASTPELAHNTQSSLSVFLDLLGWAYDKVGPKADNFSPSTAALGVVFDMDKSDNGMISVSNTEKRISETRAMIDSFLEKGEMSFKESQVARGRLAFCDAHIFGRAGKTALQEISNRGYAKPFRSTLGNRLRCSLEKLKDRLLNGKPRVVSAMLSESFFLFTDASLDDDGNGGLGAVLYDQHGNLVEWFSLLFTPDQVDFLRDPGQQTIIGELETLGVAMALAMWSSVLRSRRVVIFVDNEGSKFSLIRGYSTSSTITAICRMVSICLDEGVIIPWITRAPSASNIADYPSRGIEHSLLVKGAQASPKDVKGCFDECQRLVAAGLQGHR